MICKVVFVLASLCVLVSVAKYDAYQEYLDRKNTFLRDEEQMMLGSQIKLSAKEKQANKTLMKLKHQVLDEGFQNTQYFNFSKHYADFRTDMEKTKLYKWVARMPKGAVLHVHDMALLGPDYLMNLTHGDNLFVCWECEGDESREKVQLRWAYIKPKSPCRCDAKIHEWRSVKEARQNSKTFDERLRNRFTMLHRDMVNADVNKSWLRFIGLFLEIAPLISYKPIWEKYWLDAMKVFHEDGALYLEVRSVLPPLYELDGKESDAIETARVYERAAQRFARENPRWIGARLIYAPVRFALDAESLKKELKLARQLRNEMPNFVAGFDLVGQEDLGRTLKDFALELVEANDVPFFFHAGETDWNGLTDENIIDAVALGTRRLGHAYALPKHPAVFEEVKKRNIGIEVNVLSNQVLGLVHDLRNHPLALLLAQGAPVIISSDDPGLWEAPPLSHDFYTAWVGIASFHADLRTLKQLALNSIKYSEMTTEEKKRAIVIFNEDWLAWIENVIKSELDTKQKIEL